MPLFTIHDRLQDTFIEAYFDTTENVYRIHVHDSDGVIICNYAFDQYSDVLEYVQYALES